MQRYKCKIAYVGTNFAGYQIQPGKRTVQGELEQALAKLHKGDSIRVYASGRTDAGVHAKGQVIHFDSPLAIPLEKWTIALNTLLPDDVSALEVEKASQEFHARYSVVKKEYRYYVYLANIRDPFKQPFAYQYKYPVNVSDMLLAAKFLTGTHDFTSFCSAKTEVEDRIRTIYEIDIFQEDDFLVFRFVGNGFLYNMVRILVGTLLEVGSGQRDPLSIKEILTAQDRTLAGKTAPAHGLYLWEVFY
jgi:tRNA pseudouridine38-40 synthase